MKLSQALDLYNYNVWANKEIINRLKELPQDIYHHDIQCGFSSIAEVLTHIYLVEQTWFGIITGQSMDEELVRASSLQTQLESKHIEELENLYEDLSHKNISILIHQENMEQKIIVNNPYAGLLETSISESIIHIVTHGNYHRGNIATMLRQLGYPSVMQDYGLYLYKRESMKAE